MRRPLLLLSLIGLVAAGVAALPAAGRDIVLESFDADIRVNLDGTIAVTETIRPRFIGSWNGIIRSLPVEYRTPQGFNYKLLVELDTITDERGNSLRYETSRVRHYQEFKIWVPGARDARRTVVIRYRVPNALRFFEEHDELYWNVTGDEWEMPIEAATARILLPAGAGGVRAVTFTGGYGSREQSADVTIQENEVRVRTRRQLAFREGLTVAVGWNPGLVRRPSPGSQAALFLRSNWPLFIPVGVFGLMFWLWYTRGRDPGLRAVAAQYAPPEGLTPAEVGTLIDNAADMRDITATLVDLAVRGYLLIEETEEEKLFGLLGGKEYVFHRRKPSSEWDGLKPHEGKLLKSLFSYGGDTVRLSELENKFYKDLPSIRDRVFDALRQRRFYGSRPDKVKKFYLTAAVVVGAVSFWGGGFLAGLTGLAPATVVASGLLSAVAIAGIGWFMPVRTLEGTRALEGVLGFEEFLGRVEADRYDRMVKTPGMFEKYLPYAMALGVEKNWVKAFEDIYRQPPEWYRGPRSGMDFHPRSFVSDLGRMSSRAASAMASAPRSSGGSGFGGGGFSGGGFGGGGGRGF
ncbi:MAG: DUF2207 domain-containing protein [Acidobacteria bacterium]|nr:DUF2207 domain-containing protein [Acidobacteriota bacterium]